MPVETIDTIVVGGGQAGIAMSEHLGRLSVPHLVLERARIAERWRSERWDSLVANGPAWHDRFPGAQFPGGPEDFVPKDSVADYFVDYARQIAAPVRCGVEVRKVTKLPEQRGFLVETSHGDYQALNVVAATGPFQKPVTPQLIDADAPVLQMHSNGYRNPKALPDGAVLVVGAGSSGVQIADELNRAGRKVYLSVGPHDRPPRAYRGRDFVWWLGVLGLWDLATPPEGAEHVTIAVSGARGGETIDFRRLADEGITLLGRTQSYADGTLGFLDNVAQMVRAGDENYLALLDAADAYVARNGLTLPEEPQARVIRPDPDCLSNPITTLDLTESGIAAVIWATGYVQDYSWLEVPTFDGAGKPIHRRGVSEEPGIYFLGLPWQSRRGSSFIWGVWHDARHVADQIAIRHAYFDYHDSTDAETPATAQR